MTMRPENGGRVHRSLHRRLRQRQMFGTPPATSGETRTPRLLVKDLKVKGAGRTLKQGTVIRSIRPTDNPEEIDCRNDAIKGLVLRTEFVRKR